MRNHGKAGAALLLAVLILLAALPCGSAEMPAATGVDLGRYYETMVYLVELKAYDAARRCINDHGLSGYRDTSAYVIYIDAASAYDAAMGEYRAETADKAKTADSLEMLRDQFDGLAQQGFRDSELWAGYLNGLIAELSEDYEAAVEGYKSTILFQDSSERLAACRECLRSQSAQLLEAQYSDAVRTGAEARAANDPEAMKKALALFENLGDHRDSKAQAEACRAWIAAANRVLSLLAAPTSDTGIGVAVTDSNPGEKTQYAAQVTAVGCTVPSKTLRFTGAGVEIDGLLPDTAYTVRVWDADEQTAAAQCETATYAPALWQDGKIRVVYRSLYGFRRIFLSILQPEEIASNYSVLEHQEGAVLNLVQADIDEQDMAYLVMLTFDAGFSSFQGEAHETRCILRVKNGGAYAADPEKMTFAGETVIIPLEKLLGACYADLGAWPAENMTVEMYIDGALAGTMTLRVKTEQ